MVAWAKVVEGLIIGVGASLTATAILGVRHYIRRYLDRNEQIRYLRTLIESERERILSVTDLPPSEPLNETIPAEAIRFVYFREFETALSVALSSRATALTYKEVSSLRKSLADADRAMTDLPLRERRIMPLVIAQNMFGSFQSMEWLRLPEET